MKVFKKICKVLLSKKIFSNPSKKTLFIYDGNTYSDGYKNLLDEDDSFIFDTRDKKLYILLYIDLVLDY